MKKVALGKQGRHTLYETIMELCLLQLTKIVVLFIDRGRAIRSLGFELGLIQIRLSTGLPPSRLLNSINPQLYPCVMPAINSPVRICTFTLLVLLPVFTRTLTRLVEDIDQS